MSAFVFSVLRQSGGALILTRTIREGWPIQCAAAIHSRKKVLPLTIVSILGSQQVHCHYCANVLLLSKIGKAEMAATLTLDKEQLGDF